MSASAALGLVEVLPRYPFPPASLTGPPPDYASRRTSCPLGRVRLPSAGEAVLLVTYRDIAAAVADPRLSHDLTAPGAPRTAAGPGIQDDPDVIFNMDGARHRRLRRLAANAFTPRRLSRWLPAVGAIAGELADQLPREGGPVDLAALFCVPLPVEVMREVLGLPAPDAALFRTWSAAFSSTVRLTSVRRQELIAQLSAYVTELIGRRRREPGTGLIDDLIAARLGDDRLSEQELLYMVLTLTAAGNDITSTALGKALLVLLDGGGEWWARLVAEPGLLPAAVDELLRYAALGGGGMLRVAAADVELPSGTVKAGEAVVIPLAAAHRDPQAYPDPDEVRLDRGAQPPLLVFGGGPHHCMGAALARAELTAALGALLERFPGMRLAVRAERLRLSEGSITSPVASLPVVLE